MPVTIRNILSLLTFFKQHGLKIRRNFIYDEEPKKLIFFYKIPNILVTITMLKMNQEILQKDL